PSNRIWATPAPRATMTRRWPAHANRSANRSAPDERFAPTRPTSRAPPATPKSRVAIRRDMQRRASRERARRTQGRATRVWIAAAPYPPSRPPVRCRRSAEASLSPVELRDRSDQMRLREVGPMRVDEHELGIGRLPDQKVAEPLLAARANEEVRIRQ